MQRLYFVPRATCWLRRHATTLPPPPPPSGAVSPSPAIQTTKRERQAKNSLIFLFDVARRGEPVEFLPLANILSKSQDFAIARKHIEQWKAVGSVEDLCRRHSDTFDTLTRNGQMLISVPPGVPRPQSHMENYQNTGSSSSTIPRHSAVVRVDLTSLP